MELGMRDCQAVYDRLVVSEHIRFLANRDTQISQGVPEIDKLVNTNMSSDKLRAISGSFDCCLLLGVPVNRGLVGKV